MTIGARFGGQTVTVLSRVQTAQRPLWEASSGFVTNHGEAVEMEIDPEEIQETTTTATRKFAQQTSAHSVDGRD